ncbi:MAG: nuclear transport factor 2 family protein [Prochloraceae cyanobacterium]|nr:nuclear transport factor 2 family protein [Prochloraceae cyanobacterium]
MSQTADNTIRSIYEAIDRRDVDGAMEFIDDKCLYEDLNFPTPFQGKAAVRKLFTKSCENIPKDLLFVIDDLTSTDPLAVGVVWHVELNGIPIPNGRGVSFYRFSETTGKLIYARDIVEPPIKPGNVSFIIIRLISPLVRRFLSKQPKTKQTQPVVALFLWLLAGTYLYILLLSPPGQILPGYPAWAIPPDTLKEVLGESINFFFILPIANAIGIKLMEAPEIHPVSQGFFNFAEAWIFMFLPLILADRRGDKLPKIPIWGMAMFLTNVFLTPYMALRAAQPIPETEANKQKDILARVFGWIGLIVGIISIWWFCFAGGPEFGNLTTRMQYFVTQLSSDRVTIAFSIDLILFYIFQIVLMGSVVEKMSWLRFVPFWGLIGWLIL